MTTRVTVDAHAGWDVSVEAIDPETNEVKSKSLVEKGNKSDFYVWDTQALLIKEVKE